jgi:hypothetical protein
MEASVVLPTPGLPSRQGFIRQVLGVDHQPGGEQLAHHFFLARGFAAARQDEPDAEARL